MVVDTDNGHGHGHSKTSISDINKKFNPISDIMSDSVLFSPMSDYSDIIRPKYQPECPPMLTRYPLLSFSSHCFGVFL
jgi:hypothetical protein